MPAPAVAERTSTMRSPISAAGIRVATQSQPGQPGRGSKPVMWPRRPETMALMRAVASFGQTTSTASTGSSSTGPAFSSPSRMARWVACLNAISEESTEWKAPSVSVTSTSTTGKPSGPAASDSRAPASTAGMYWRGTTPPVMRSTKEKPAPRGRGASSIVTSANWPWPPDCFLWRPRTVAAVRIVSL